MFMYIFIEYGQDKILQPHQVRKPECQPGLFYGSALQLEQSKTLQGVRMRTYHCWHH